MQQITVDELKLRMDSGEHINLIDVREPFEYAEFNLGGKLIPLGKIQSFQLEELEDLKGEEVIIHCKAGSRSMTACAILESAGFTNLKNVTGGVLAWKQKFG
jgi:rhodanese-related sulfurtransferase